MANFVMVHAHGFHFFNYFVRKTSTVDESHGPPAKKKTESQSSETVVTTFTLSNEKADKKSSTKQTAEAESRLNRVNLFKEC